MKRIAIFYRNRINYSGIQYIEDNLLSILDGYVEIRNLFLNELEEFEQIEADAFLVLYEEMLPLLVKHIRDFSKIIVITRSIKREHIQPLLALPSGTDVLVVNDSRESTLQTVFITYEVGIGHLNLIPFDADLYQRGAYDTIDHAIVACGSEELVPPHIHHVINIRNRDVSFVTFQNIIRQLHLENTPAQSNLLRKVQDDLDTDSTFIENYLGGYLKDQLLLSAVGNLQAGILLLDRTGHVHYVNERAHQILGLINGDTVTGTAGLDPIFTDRREYRDHLVHLEESNYLIQKRAIKIADTTIGYSFVLQSEKDLRDSEAGLNARLKSKGLYAKYTFDDIVSRSHAMNRSLEDARRIASSEYTVLIRGESGTGKELVAQSIHNYSRRKNAPFVAVNCAALPETLLESELFGYEPGAFTGAKKDGKVGLFERAQNGTIFLDEIGNISDSMQAQLLRVLQEKQIMRVGSDRIIDINVRIIAATNADLEARIESGDFRRDLFYRLNVLSLTLVPLRERRADILPLLRTFLGTKFEQLTPAEREALTAYQWPGNVRELENCAHYYQTLNALPPAILRGAGNRPTGDAKAEPTETTRPAAPAPAPAPVRLTEEAATRAILRAIATHSDAFSGIGRRHLQSLLAEEGLRLGEGKLRLLMRKLSQDGLLEPTTGRAGTRITAAGLAFLAGHDTGS